MRSATRVVGLLAALGLGACGSTEIAATARDQDASGAAASLGVEDSGPGSTAHDAGGASTGSVEASVPAQVGATDASVPQGVPDASVPQGVPDASLPPAIADASPLRGVADAGPSPTVSSWLGTNVGGDLARIDVTYQLNPFDTPAAQQDANGYPLAGVSGTSRTDLGFVLPSGTYAISYRGTGALAVSGIGSVGGPFQPSQGTQRSTVVVTATPGTFGRFLTLAITNGPGQTVTDIRILMPGFDVDTQATFLPQFLALLGPFRALRFMDWEATNGSTLTAWSDRPTATHFGHSPHGEPVEHIAELVNETGKDAWITIPEGATSDFIASFASWMASSLDFDRIAAARARSGMVTPFQLFVENSNETWNQGFTAYSTLLAQAKAQPTRYTGVYDGTFGPSWMTASADLMRVGQVDADRLVQIGNAFRAAFGSRAGAVAPVLSGWALGPGYSDVGLRFIKAHYGDPKAYVSAVALAPYFGPPDDTSTSTLPSLFGAIDTNIVGMGATYTQFAQLGSAYGIPIAAYEGGQGLSGATNQPIKHLAQHDARMYSAYKKYLALWTNHFPNSLFMHFSLAGTPGLPESIYQYGYWGSILGVLEDPATCEPNLPTLNGTEAVASVVHHCPKYRALAEAVSP